MLFHRGFSNVRNLIKLISIPILISDLYLASSVEVTYSSHGVFDKMPVSVNLTLATSTNDKRTFNLTHVEQFDLDTDLFTMTTSPDGHLQYKKEDLVDDQNTGFYQDVTNSALFQVVRTDQTTMDPRPALQFEGQFVLGNVTYTLNVETRARRDVTLSVRSSEVVYTLRRQPQRGQHFYDDIKSSNFSEDVKMTVMMRSPTPVRRSRQAPATYYIDIAAVVDFKSYSIFLKRYVNRATALQEILEYYSYVIAGVDLLYQGITSTDYRIRVRLIKVIVAEVASASKFTEANVIRNYMVDGGAALDAFGDFLAGSGRSLVEPYDHAMLFTGYDISRKESSSYYYDQYNTLIVGKAVLGMMCEKDGSSSSLVEDEGNFQSIEVAAHELAHSMSAQHDGLNNRCSSDDNFIMAPVDPAVRKNSNPWRFSSCTLQYFGKFFQELLKTRDGASCLTGQIPKSSNIPDLKDGLPGLKYPAHAQCRMWHGNESTVCYGENDNIPSFNPSNLCMAIWCKYASLGLSSCGSKTPLPGTPCEDGKLCLRGECVQHPEAPKSVCVFGDVPTLNCSQEVRANPILCSSTPFKRYCCESCSAHHKALERENLPNLTTSTANPIERGNLSYLTTSMATAKEPGDLPNSTALMHTAKQPEDLPNLTTLMPTAKQPENTPNLTTLMPTAKQPENTPNLTTLMPTAKQPEDHPNLATSTAETVEHKNVHNSTTSMASHRPVSNVSQTADGATVPPKSESSLIVLASIEGVCIVFLVLAQIGCCLKFKALKQKYASAINSESDEATLL